MNQRSRVHAIARGAALGLAAVAIAACSSGAPTDGPARSTTPAASQAPAASAAASAAATAAPTVGVKVVKPASGVLPRVIAYGGLTWTIKEAVITNQDPAAYAPGVDGAPTAQTWLILDLGLQNDNTKVNILLDDARWVAKLADGTKVNGQNLKKVGVPAVSTAVGRYAFEVPAATTFDGLTVSVADPGKEPSREQPLSGTQPVAAEAAATSTPTNVKGAVPLPGIEMTWTIQKLSVWRDWPLPIGFPGGAQPAMERADSGMVWLGVVVKVNVGTCNCVGGIIDQAGNTRLLVNGSPVTPSEKQSSLQIMNAQTVSDVQLVFQVPAGTKTATLQVGPLDKADQQVKIELTLPAAS